MKMRTSLIPYNGYLDPEFLRLGLSERDIKRQLLLHLCQFGESQLTPCLVKTEAIRIAEHLINIRKSIPGELRTNREVVSLRDTRLIKVDASLAKALHHSYHYLSSPRLDGVHLALCNKASRGGKFDVLALATFSPFDMRHVVDALPFGIKEENVLVLSRLYAFDWAPRNAISYMLGRAFEWIRTFHPHIKMLLTYLNPNLGFTGTAYKATNWLLFGREFKQRYLYLDGLYVTDRMMIQAYGTARLEALRSKLGDRISASTDPLEPLEIQAYFFERSSRLCFSDHRPYRFEPWSL